MTKTAISIITATLFAISAGAPSHAQTEGFNVKTPVQTVADDSSSLINDISADSKRDPKNSIPQDMICKAECYLVVPTVYVVPGREEFAGTGLLGCRYADSGKIAPPLFFQITDIESFNENGGGVIILVMDRNGVKSILGDQLQLTAGNSSGGKIGPGTDVGNPKPFITYSRPRGDSVETFDASGSTLVYASGDTFNAYQQDLDPIDIMLFGIDIPPALRGFNSALEEWRKGCK